MQGLLQGIAWRHMGWDSGLSEMGGTFVQMGLNCYCLRFPLFFWAWQWFVKYNQVDLWPHLDS